MSVCLLSFCPLASGAPLLLMLHELRILLQHALHLRLAAGEFHSGLFRAAGASLAFLFALLAWGAGGLVSLYLIC